MIYTSEENEQFGNVEREGDFWLRKQGVNKYLLEISLHYLEIEILSNTRLFSMCSIDKKNREVHISIHDA